MTSREAAQLAFLAALEAEKQRRAAELQRPQLHPTRELPADRPDEPPYRPHGT